MTEDFAKQADSDDVDGGKLPEGLGNTGGRWFGRLLWTFFATIRLSAVQRRESGLSWWRLLVDPGGAHRIARRFLGISYREWVETADALCDGDRLAIAAHIARWQQPPRFRVVLVGEADPGLRAQTIDSLQAQLYAGYRLDVGEPNGDAGNGSGGRVGNAPNARHDTDPDGCGWLLLLRAGDRLAEHALYWFACAAMAEPEAAIIYADDDEIEAGSRCRPRFKPDWSLAHLRETDYVGRAAVLAAPAVQQAGGVQGANRAGDTWELLLRVAERAAERVRHVPAVLLHRDATVERRFPPSLRRVRYALPEEPPRVSIVVPTRDAASLLERCVESVLARTTYPRFELVLIDNGSREPDALAFLEQAAQRENVRVIRDERPFNYSALNNAAVRAVDGEVLCLLNNDVEVISPDWLDEMVGQLLQDRVGAVGAKLYYADGRVQHAGDTVGQGGCANHLHQFIARDDAGYCNRARVAQNLSAVTAACMVTWRDLYQRLGGLDERWLPVAFNDVDYCLRVRQAGFRVVWTPHAELYHHESASRRKFKGLRSEIRAWREARFMRWKWKERLRVDPFYNPNFTCLRANFALAPVPNVQKPWRDPAGRSC